MSFPEESNATTTTTVPTTSPSSHPWTPEHDQLNQCQVVFFILLFFLLFVLGYVVYNAPYFIQEGVRASAYPRGLPCSLALALCFSAVVSTLTAAYTGVAACGGDLHDAWRTALVSTAVFSGVLLAFVTAGNYLAYMLCWPRFDCRTDRGGYQEI